MKKLISIMIITLLIFGIIAISYISNKNNKNLDKSSSIIQNTSLTGEIQKYLEDQYTHGYGCDIISGSKYFFSFVTIPYQTNNQYLINYTIGGYYKTDLGNITSCGAGGGTLIIKREYENIVLIHQFSDFPGGDEEYILPKDLITKYTISNTTYEQAQQYFHYDEDQSFYKQCPKELCNKIRYSIIETGDDLNDDIDLYTTERPKELESQQGRRSMTFSGDFTMIENHRGCSNNGRCQNTGVRRYINEQTIEYPLAGDNTRKQRFEIRDLDNTILKIRYIYSY